MSTLPFHFNGRDFSTKNNMYLQKLLEFHEMQRILYLTSLQHQKSLDLNHFNLDSKRHCTCPDFMKCYHFIIHNPLFMTAEFATKISSNMAQNKKETDLFITSRPIDVGNTSLTHLISLRHKQMQKPLITKILLSCHIDTNTKRPIRVCDKRRNYVNHMLSMQKDKELIKLKKLKHELRINMDRMSVLLKDNNCLFECKLQIQHNDIDLNYHVNQAVYGKFIENTLFEYSKEYYNGKYFVVAFTINYIKEIIMKGFGNGLPFCVVRICNDIDVNEQKKEIVGMVEENNILCAQFKIVLVVDDGSRIQQIRSLL